MKVKDLKKALKNVPDNLDVIISNLGPNAKLNSPDGFRTKKAGMVVETGLWPKGFWIEIGRGFRY